MMQNTHDGESVAGTSAGALFKWAGSKRSLAPELMARVPESFGHYYEPFLGAGWLFWSLANAGRLTPGQITLSDSCSPLVRAWRGVLQDPTEVVRLLTSYPITSEWFYRLRSLHPDRLEGDPELAAWFIFLNKTCFNGLWRVNREGKMNVPWGRWELTNRMPKVFDEEELHAASRTLDRLIAIPVALPFEAALEEAKEGDFAYFDPPYLPASKTSNFTSYTPGGFSYDDHVRLRDVALGLKRRGVHVMVSNADVPRIRELYDADFQVETVQAPRAINSKATGRGKVSEIIAR